MLSISQTKLFKRIKKRQLNLNIEFERAIFINNFRQQEKIIKPHKDT